MFNGFLGEKIFVHAIVALFVLKLETELFHFVLSDYMRADVERFGRVQISETQAERNETSKRIAIAGFCTFSMIPVLCSWLIIRSAHYDSAETLAGWEHWQSIQDSLADFTMAFVLWGCVGMLVVANQAGKTKEEEASNTSGCSRVLQAMLSAIFWLAFFHLGLLLSSW